MLRVCVAIGFATVAGSCCFFFWLSVMLVVLHCFRVIMPDGDASIRGFAVAGSSAGGHHPSLDLSEKSESARKFLVVGRMKSPRVVLGLSLARGDESIVVILLEAVLAHQDSRFVFSLEGSRLCT